MHILSLYCVVIWILVITLCQSDNDVFGSRVYMDRRQEIPAINVTVSWSINVKMQKIYIETIAPITSENSWMALGISDTGGMKGADIALISLYHNKIYDLHSEDFVLPIMDKVQNWELTYLETFHDGQGYSITQFNRHLQTCDSEDYVIDTNLYKHQIMIAYHFNDYKLSETNDYALSISRHQFTAFHEVNLFLNEELFIATNNENSTYYDLIIPSEQLVYKSHGNTQYFCVYVNITENKYITGFEMIDPTNPAILHHVQVSFCENIEPDKLHFHPNQCNVDMECRFFLTTAKGATPTFPSKVYYALEKGIYYVEVHLDLTVLPQIASEALSKGVDIKGAGMRLYNTDEPRELQMDLIYFEADLFEIPPQTKDYELSYAMYSECTNDVLPPDGIDMIYMGGHMHYTGSQLKVDRMRGNELSTIYSIKRWDFNRQFASSIHQTLKPNDTLRVSCYYDTMDRVNVTTYGLSANDEMCVVVMGYVTPYKLNNISNVFAIPSHNDLMKPSYCGPVLLEYWNQTQSNTLSKFIYDNTQNIHSSNDDNWDIMDKSDVYCHALVFDAVNLISNDLIFRIDIPFITLYSAMWLLLTILFFIYLIDTLLNKMKPGIYSQFENKMSERRKINVYMFSTLFYSFLFVILLECILNRDSNPGLTILTEPSYKITFHEYDKVKSKDYPPQIPLVSNLVILFFGIELFYRSTLKWHLILHHVLTMIMIIVLMTAAQTTLNGGFPGKIGFYYLAQVATEQPIFVSLFMRKLRLSCCTWNNYPKLFYFSSIWHYLTKITTTALITYYYLQSLLGKDSEYWYLYNISYSKFLKEASMVYPVEMINWEIFTDVMLAVLIPFLFLLQLYQGIFFWKLAQDRRKEPTPDETMLNISISNHINDQRKETLQSGIVAITEQDDKEEIYDTDLTNIDDDEDFIQPIPIELPAMTPQTLEITDNNLSKQKQVSSPTPNVSIDELWNTANSNNIQESPSTPKQDIFLALNSRSPSPKQGVRPSNLTLFVADYIQSQTINHQQHDDDQHDDNNPALD